MKSILAITACLIFIYSCGSSVALTKPEEVTPNEAIAIAKIRINYNGEDVTDKSIIAINNDKFGTGANQTYPDENGFIYAKLPLGTNSINRIIIKPGSQYHDFDSEELTFQLDHAQSVYYLGDITVDWNGPSMNAVLATSVLVPFGRAFTKGKINVFVTSNLVSAQEAFQNKFSSKLDVKTSLLSDKLK